MNAEERRIIEDLFDKLEAVGRQSGPADPEAEALIERRLARQAGGAYRMAQTIVVQERALEEAHARLAEVEQRGAPARGQGGFLEGLWGGPRRDARVGASTSGAMPGGASGPWGPASGSRQVGYGTGHGRGGGFLAGAAQTAMGVAGGVVLGSFLADALTPDAAFAGDDGASDPGDYAGGGEPAEDLGGDAGDFGGDFGGE